MAYFEPPLAVTGDVIAASLWNTYVRNNFRAVKGTDGPFAMDSTLNVAGAGSFGTGLSVAGGFTLSSGGMAGNAAVRTYLPAQGFIPLSAVGQPFVEAGGPQYELEFYSTGDGYATTKLAIPWNFQGGVVRFRIRYYTPSGGQQVTWRIGAGIYALGSSARTSWGMVADVNATTLSGSYSLSEAVINWSLSAGMAGAEIKLYLQRLAIAAAWDTSGESAYVQSVFVEFGV